MAAPRALPQEFYARGALEVARDLIGKWLAHRTPEGLCLGRIIETEAYCGVKDHACHTFGGRRTARTETMWGPPGHAYVYFVYGMHWCLNAVCAQQGDPQAVLLRAVQPLRGEDLMRQRRGVRAKGLADGPAKLCAAFAVTGAADAAPLFRGALRILDGPAVAAESILQTPRIGVGYAGPDALQPWRFLMHPPDKVERTLP